MAYPKKKSEELEKRPSKIYLTEDAKEQLIILSRKLKLSQSDVVELLIRQTYTSHIELANIKYLESREEIFKKIIQDLQMIKGEINQLKGD